MKRPCAIAARKRASAAAADESWLQTGCATTVAQAKALSVDPTRMRITLLQTMSTPCASILAHTDARRAALRWSSAGLPVDSNTQNDEPHRELIAHIRDDRRGDPNSRGGGQQQRAGKGGHCIPDADRQGGQHRNQHRGAEPIDSGRTALARNPVAENDIQYEQSAVR